MGSVTFDLAGGANGDCPADGGIGSTAPSGGEVTATLDGGCLDVDGDGFPSSQCQATGGDCDDSDPTIHPGAPEICDGKDNDCDGKIDEAPNDCTPQGLVCVSGRCAAPGTNPDAGSGAGGGSSPPQQIDLNGGCHVPEGLPQHGGTALAVAFAAMALLASRGKKRRR
jgi:hypothetical protein